MNIERIPRPSPASHLTIEVVQDLVCPWCRLGLRRLLRTLAGRRGITYSLVWRPFLLNPDIAGGGIPRGDYLTRKFGGEERARRLYASITEIGRGDGLEFRFDLIRRVPSSVDAHRLLRWAAPHCADGGAALAEALYDAHFAEGRDIGSHAVLAALAAAQGLDPGQTRRLLASDQDRDLVFAENLRAHRLGINGVPCLVVGGRHAISGAQDPEVIGRLLDVAVVEAAEG